jgi:glycerol-3-phosphate dehydrogenase (NAD(P)+)
MKVAVLGAGAWGTALAHLLSEKGDEVRLWTRRADLAAAINAAGENVRYLPGAKLTRNVRATDALGPALEGAAMILFVVPSHATREVAREAAPHVRTGVPIVSATKGIENESLMFMDEVLAEELPHARSHFAFLSGPSFAKELANRLPTAIVIASRDAALGSQVMHSFHTPYLRTYASDDVAGVECGGALKNVIAIAAGAVDGMGFGHNTRAALITRGLSEVAKLAMARGGSALTLAGLAGMGDLVLTCTGDLSRNRAVGMGLGKGQRLTEVLAGMSQVAEGVKTTRSAQDLSERLGVEMPITRAMYRLLYEDVPAVEVLVELLGRTPKHELA